MFSCAYIAHLSLSLSLSLSLLSERERDLLDAHKASLSQKLSLWAVASWNVRTLLDIEGPLENARQGDNVHDVVDERKIHQAVDVCVGV